MQVDALRGRERVPLADTEAREGHCRRKLWATTLPIRERNWRFERDPPKQRGEARREHLAVAIVVAAASQHRLVDGISRDSRGPRVQRASSTPTPSAKPTQEELLRCSTDVGGRLAARTSWNEGSTILTSCGCKRRDTCERESGFLR